MAQPQNAITQPVGIATAGDTDKDLQNEPQTHQAAHIERDGKSTGVAYQAQISNSGAEDFSDVTLLLLIGYVLQKDTSESRPSKYRALQLRKANVARIPAGKIASAAFDVFWEIDSQIINEISLSNFAGRTTGTRHFITKSNTKIESAQLLVLDSSGRLLYQSRL